MAPIIFSDFDGTIVQVDVTDAILNEFAKPAWRDVEEEWVAGRIGSRECLRQQMALVRASAHDLNALIDSVPLDPGFAAFQSWTRGQGIPFYVVSDGFDYVIRRVLRRCGIDGELRNASHLFASSMRIEGGTIRVNFPHPAFPCVHGCATCKPEVIRRVSSSHSPVIFIGDGLSDRFAIEEADVVFAKDRLLTYCCDRGIAAVPFSTFDDIERKLHSLLNAGADVRGRHGTERRPALVRA